MAAPSTKRRGRLRNVRVLWLVLPLVLLAVTVPVRAAPGDVDPTFDSDGKVVSDFGSDERAEGVAVQPDGRIVVAGTGCNGDFLVIRYLSDGTLDPTFDGDGWTCVDVRGDGSADQGAEVVALPDGRLLVAGTSAGDFALIQLTAGGQLDPTFGTGGRATYDIGGAEVLRDVALAPDGKIVMAGETTGPGCPLAPVMPGQTAGVAVARATPEGALDPGFGSGGRFVRIDESQVQRSFAVAVQLDGRPVVGGHTSSCSRVAIDSLVFRLTAAGAEDPTFSAANVLNEPGPDQVVDLDVQPDGRTLALINTFVGPATSPARDDAFTVVRYNPDGSADASFGSNGVATALFGAGRNATPSALALLPDGSIVAAGTVDGDFAVARFAANGVLDPSFGGNGMVTTDFGGNDGATAVAVQPDGKVVAAGFTGANVALARYGTSTSGTTITTVGPTTTTTVAPTTTLVPTTTTLVPSPFDTVCSILRQLTAAFRQSPLLQPFAAILEPLSRAFCSG